jgi:hypothetical protein
MVRPGAIALVVLAVAASGCGSSVAVPSDKQARINHLASLQAMAPSILPSKGPNVGFVSLPPSSEPPFSPYKQVPAGDGFIVESDLGLPGQSDAVYANDWYEVTSTGVTEVYAGGRQSDPSVGFLDVITWDADHANIIRSGEYETPQKHGVVTISGATTDVLTVTASDGATFTFDVSALSYR